ncbi:MAG TPA: hypothetical protein VKI65_03360 [Gemmataceae bacterium]|nr:hypothetical protein [Gemmataceae bacterium]
MRRGIVAWIAVGVLGWANTPLLAQFGGPRDWDPAAEKHGWLSNFEEAKARARKSGKPLMVVFRCVL